MLSKSTVKDLLELNTKIKRKLQIKLTEYNLSYPQWTVLKTIKTLEPEAMARDICTISGIDKATMSDILNRLIAKGIIKRNVNPKDKRGNLLFLSDEIKVKCDEINKMEEKFTKELFNILDKEETKTFSKLVHKLNKEIKVEDYE